MLANGSLKPIWSTQFRLLAADYNDQTEELKLRSEVYVLSGSLIPPYLAISYTWFDAPSKDDARPRAIPAKRLPTLTDQVTVDDRPVPVTRNLANAIHHVVSKEWSLRPKTMGVKRSLRLWCDYLCIDQTNAIEKGQQVQHMTNIFGNATKVIAWLGLPYNEEEAQFAIALMSRVGVTYRDCVAEGVTWVRRIYRDHPEIWPEHSEWSAKVVSLHQPFFPVQRSLDACHQTGARLVQILISNATSGETSKRYSIYQIGPEPLSTKKSRPLTPRHSGTAPTVSM